MVTDADIISTIILREGGFSDDPGDRGGATMFGITQATLAAWRRHPVTVDDVRNLSLMEAETIYEDIYLKPFRLVTPGELRAFLVDSAVNHGVVGAIKLLQESLRVTQDGVFGPKTQAALDKRPWRMVLADSIADRVRLYGRIVQQHPSDVTFIAGWLNRVAPFISELA